MRCKIMRKVYVTQYYFNWKQKVLVYLHYNIDRLGFVIVVLNYNLQRKMIELRLS